jgi:hypothetical protein
VLCALARTGVSNDISNPIRKSFFIAILPFLMGNVDIWSLTAVTVLLLALRSNAHNRVFFDGSSFA